MVTDPYGGRRWELLGQSWALLPPFLLLRRLQLGMFGGGLLIRRRSRLGWGNDPIPVRLPKVAR